MSDTETPKERLERLHKPPYPWSDNVVWRWATKEDYDWPMCVCGAAVEAVEQDGMNLTMEILARAIEDTEPAGPGR